jgi:hypothetical protein
MARNPRGSSRYAVEPDASIATPIRRKPVKDDGPSLTFNARSEFPGVSPVDGTGPMAPSHEWAAPVIWRT